MGDIHIENMFARKSAIRRRGETLVKYTSESGLEDWIGNISGTILGRKSSPYYTTKIPNVNQAMSISLGNGVTNIGRYAFNHCTNLTSVTIFNGLTNVTIPNSVTSIDDYAFFDCSGLTSITIGSGISTIPENAFYNCDRCMVFDFRRSTSVPTLNNVSAFGNTPSNKEIIVPDALYDDWIVATNWSSDTNNIRPCIVKASQSSLGVLETLTYVTYTEESGLGYWSGEIRGEISGSSSSPYYTTQIPNIEYAKTI